MLTARAGLAATPDAILSMMRKKVFIDVWRFGLLGAIVGKEARRTR
jgi:hypothetical protein